MHSALAHIETQHSSSTFSNHVW